MKNKDVKNAIDNIKIDDDTKVRILNKIQIENEKQERGIYMKINNKILVTVASMVLVVGGIFVFNNDINKGKINEVTLGTSPVITEKLAINGVIESINPSDKNNDMIIKVIGDKKEGAIFYDINVNASTNIFNKGEDDLLYIKDLSKGQKVEVYYDGSESDGQISALRIEIIK